MKILCAEYNAEGRVAIVPVGDDALLRNNDDFYIPEFTSRLSCVPQLVIRLCKLGKGVSERFASRYYEEIGVGIRFYADDLEQDLQAANLPTVMASSFGGSAAISNLVEKEKCGKAAYSLWVNGLNVYEGDLSSLPVGIEKLISLSSDFHTLKIGDFLYSGNVFRYRGLQLGDRIEVRLDGKEFMDFKLK